ncbi:MAG: UvrD-helicase domain-containing protein [Candidatus Pristimantibacillus lignocellulolyticus]|uniref:DNA 3'-5' helicase n=1 Tax=Candidatus Pristimantibacillus lignocellulolyticus TaxID=2994561 RepID=A0A9J6ZAW3_9BACL|nr:MAG: UvrD-helicase domain-containing protein [Candidatus Pristimantibacillus lignocellulolyticus]
MIDQEARDGILTDNGNIMVSASAGSGKTTIMVKKMAIEIDKIADHRTIAAVTFTVKATQEIKKKASGQVNKPFVVMTNDSFIEHEIIRPFIKDAIGNDYDSNYTIEYGNDYKFQDYDSGLEQLRINKILGSFRDIKKNFNFKLALNVLGSSVAAQEYIKSKYAIVFIDEYQDSDEDMHRFFMFLKNKLNIKLFIVGDSKQAIYLWRGAKENIFQLLVNENFIVYELVKNFRCHKEIENFANIFHNPNYYYKANDDVKNVIIKEYSSNNRSGFSGFVDEFEDLVDQEKLDLKKEITIIANINNDAQRIAELLMEAGYDFVFIPKTPIEDGLPNGNLLWELALFTKNPIYSIYDFIEKTGIDERSQTRIEVYQIIRGLKNNGKLSPEMVSSILSNLASFLGITINIDESEKFYKSISEGKYEMAFQINEKKHKVMTVFASKGLEFDQVISFSKYYKIHENENLQNHYVCITRAKEKFIMFNDNTNYFNYLQEVAIQANILDIKKLVEYKL